jgi:high-affinity iron transporter
VTHPRSYVALLAASAAVTCATEGHAQPDEPLELQAQRLEHLLGYLAADYGAFASVEHDEHVALARTGAQAAERLPRPPDVGVRIANLRSLIERFAPPPDVQAFIEALRTDLLIDYRIQDWPEGRPSQSRGRRLFEQYCAVCHGITGRGDTERAAMLRPRPANFLDPAIGEPLSPYRITTTIRFGIEGTAMVPLGFLGDAERWDIAFYVMGLRHLGSIESEPPTFTVAELAFRSDRILRSDLFAAGMTLPRSEPVLAELRCHAPYELETRLGSLRIAREALDRARVSTISGELDEAKGAVETAQRKGLQPAEAGLSSIDTSLAENIARTLATVRNQVHNGSSGRDLRESIALALQTITRAELASWRVYGSLDGVHSAVLSATIFLRRAALATIAVCVLLAVLPLAGTTERRKHVNRGWGCALGLVVAIELASVGLGVLSAAARHVLLGATSLLATFGLVCFAAPLSARDAAGNRASFSRFATTGHGAAWVAFAVAFAPVFRDAFAGATFFHPSWLVASGPRRSSVGSLLASWHSR